MCLNPECPAFWKMKNGNYAEYQLSYNTDFLHLEPPDSFPVDLVDICPAVPPTEVPDRITTTYLFTRGWHCRLCGRLSCRWVPLRVIPVLHHDVILLQVQMAVLGVRELWGKQYISAFLHLFQHWQHWVQNVHETKSRIRGPKEFWGQIDNTAVHHVNKSSG